MRDKRSICGVISATILILAAIFVGGSAQAATSSADHGKAGHVLIAPSAPQGAAAMSAKSAAASSPRTSPSVRTQHVQPGQTYDCASGNLCAVVWDPTTYNYKVYFLYTCSRYSLSYWNGTGNYYDAQTGGVTSYFYGQSGNVLKSFTPDFQNHDQDWTPVWSIRNC